MPHCSPVTIVFFLKYDWDAKSWPFQLQRVIYRVQSPWATDRTTALLFVTSNQNNSEVGVKIDNMPGLEVLHFHYKQSKAEPAFGKKTVMLDKKKMGGWEKTDWQNKYINIHYIKKIARLLQCSIVLMTGNWILAKSSLDLGDRHLFSKAYSQGQIKEALNIPYLCCYKLRLLGDFPCSEHISSSFLCVFFCVFLCHSCMTWIYVFCLLYFMKFKWI